MWLASLSFIERKMNKKKVASFASMFTADLNNLQSYEYVLQRAHTGLLSICYLFHQEEKV